MARRSTAVHRAAQQGITRLAELTGREPLPLDPSCGQECPRSLAWIDEAACIGCTLCITACPVDCIVGAAKQMHTIVESLCTGCELCLPACPVDCIHLDIATPGASGWDAWSQQQADQSRRLYRQRSERIHRLEQAESARLATQAASRPPGSAGVDAQTRQQAIAAALAKARSRRAG